jgi:hypothetical protein
MHAIGEGDSQRVLWDIVSYGGAQVRAPYIPFYVRLEGPEGRYAGLHGKTAAEFHSWIIWPYCNSVSVCSTLITGSRSKYACM